MDDTHASESGAHEGTQAPVFDVWEVKDWDNGTAVVRGTLPDGRKYTVCTIAQDLALTVVRDHNLQDPTRFAWVITDRRLIPEGTRLVEAYETPREIVVLGQPPEEVEGQESTHNCDALGCSSGTHALYRFEKGSTFAEKRLDLLKGLLKVLQKKSTNFGMGLRFIPEDGLRLMEKILYPQDAEGPLD